MALIYGTVSTMFAIMALNRIYGPVCIVSIVAPEVMRCFWPAFSVYTLVVDVV